MLPSAFQNQRKKSAKTLFGLSIPLAISLMALGLIALVFLVVTVTMGQAPHTVTTTVPVEINL